MKISFPNCGSGVGISIRASIAALLNGHKADRAQTGARKKNVPQITPGWNYRPRESFRPHAALDAARAEAKTLGSSAAVVDANNPAWFDFSNPDLTIGDVTAKAPLSAHEHAVSAYD
jgi:hypothetical protein